MTAGSIPQTCLHAVLLGLLLTGCGAADTTATPSPAPLPSPVHPDGPEIAKGTCW